MNIYAHPTEVWELFQTNKVTLKHSLRKIADNTEYGLEIFLGEENGFPKIVVTVDDEEILSKTVNVEDGCHLMVEQIYRDYLTKTALDSLSEPNDNEEDIIAEREDELTSYVCEFVDSVVPGGLDVALLDIDEAIEDIKDHFLEYLARKYGLPIYRPMYLTYEDGKEEFEEYPYENMEFEDEDNPIYAH